MLDRIEALLRRVESFPDPALRETTRELVRELLDLHRKALSGVMEVASGEAARLAADPRIAPLLLLHGLHPDGLETRVGRALEKVRPYLHSHGGDVDLLGIERGLVRLRLQGSCNGCPSSRETLKGSIEQAILEAAPDAVGIEVA